MVSGNDLTAEIISSMEVFLVRMTRLRTNTRQETKRQFMNHVKSRRFLARNTVVLFVVLVALIYQGSPIWMFPVVIVLFAGFMLAFQWVIALFWKDEIDSQ